MTVVALQSAVMAQIGEEVARSLSSAEFTSAGLFIRTPLLYPSGTSVVVRVEGSASRFFVTDLGMGHQESTMLNASGSYAMIARSLTQDTGVSFDNRSFFVAESARDELVGVVSAVANLSQRAVIETAVKHDMRKAELERATLLTRLDGAFGRRKVERDVEVRGASMIEWTVTARVASSNVVTLFDYARPHKNSVTSTVAKFHDIARIEVPPRRIVTIHGSPEMTPFVGLLSQSANVIDLERTPDEVLMRLAA